MKERSDVQEAKRKSLMRIGFMLGFGVGTAFILDSLVVSEIDTIDAQQTIATARANRQTLHNRLDTFEQIGYFDTIVKFDDNEDYSRVTVTAVVPGNERRCKVNLRALIDQETVVFEHKQSAPIDDFEQPKPPAIQAVTIAERFPPGCIR